MSLDTSNNLFTLTEAKQYLGMSTSGTSTYETRLTDLINVVSGRMNSETDRKLKARSITEYQDGNGKNYLYTKQYPINSSASSMSLYIDVTRSYGTADKIGSTDIMIYSDEGKIVVDDNNFDVGEKSVKIIYNGGYSTLPHDLVYAGKEFLRLLWNRETRNRVGIKSESAQGGNIQYEEDIPWSVRQVINTYKRRDKI